MPYADSVKQSVAAAPKTLGNQLGRWAIHLDFPVTRISAATGATRQTVYNWFNGGEVTPSYQKTVANLLKIMQSSSTAEDAWRKACKAFDLKT